MYYDLLPPSYQDTLVVPIIENTPEERDLKERMARAMRSFRSLSSGVFSMIGTTRVSW